MATVNLGRIKPVWQGTWNSSTQYIADDIVYYNNHAWIAVATSTNSAPADANSDWDKMANGAAIPDQTSHAGKVLKTDGSSLSWGASDDASALTQGTLPQSVLPAGSVVGIASATYTGDASNETENYTGGVLQTSYTPRFADSNYFFMAQCYFGYSNHDLAADIGIDISGAAPGGVITPQGASGRGHTVFALSGIGSTAADSVTDDWSIATTPAHYYWQPSSNLGTSMRTFQVVFRRRGSAGGIVWNRRWGGGTDSRNFAPVSTFTMFEIKA